MEGVRRGVLGGAYVEELRRSRVDIEEEMDVAAVETHGGCRWEPRSSSRPCSWSLRPRTPPCGRT